MPRIWALVRRGERITEGRRFYAHAYWRVDTVKDALSKLPGFRERAFDATIGIAASYDGDGRTSGLTPSTLRHAIPALRAMRRAYREDGPAAGRYRDAFAAEEAEWLAIDWSSIDDAQVEMWVREAIEQHWRTNRWAMRVSFLSQQAQDDLRGALGRLRLDPPANEGLLLANLDELATGHAARALAQLGARHARRREQVLAAERPEELPSPLREEFLDLVERFGFMAEADEELVQPRWDEDASIPLALLKATTRVTDGRATHADAEKEERRVLAASAWRARSVRRKVVLARRYAWWREELREVLMRTNRLTRRAFLSLGERWAARGLIARPDDVFWMTAGEVVEVLDGRLDLSYLAMQVPRRRRHADRFRRWRPPDTLGAPPGAGRSGTTGARLLAGTACSSGVAEGPVCILRSLEEAPKARAGIDPRARVLEPRLDAGLRRGGRAGHRGGRTALARLDRRPRAWPAGGDPGARRHTPAPRRAARAGRRRSRQRAGAGRRTNRSATQEVTVETTMQAMTNEAAFEVIGSYLSRHKAEAFKALGIGAVQGRREGVRIWDLEGRSYINCRSSGGVFNFGHRPQFAVDALKAALDEHDMGDWLLPSLRRARGAEALAQHPAGRAALHVLHAIGGGGGRGCLQACPRRHGETGDRVRRARLPRPRRAFRSRWTRTSTRGGSSRSCRAS